MNREQLKKEIAEKRRQLDNIEAAERAVVNRSLVGKFFKYLNNYSMPKKLSDYWWLYVKVLKADGWNIKTFEFQTDSDGRIEIRYNDHFHLSDGYREIRASEFRRAWASVQRKIKSLPADAGAGGAGGEVGKHRKGMIDG